MGRAACKAHAVYTGLEHVLLHPRPSPHLAVRSTGPESPELLRFQVGRRSRLLTKAKNCEKVKDGAAVGGLAHGVGGHGGLAGARQVAVHHHHHDQDNRDRKKC